MKLMSMLWSRIGALAKPLWKGTVKRLLHSKSRDMRGRVKSLIDDDADASIVRVNKFFDDRQEEIEAALRKLTWLPGSLEDTMASAVEDHGNALQEKLVEAIKGRGAAAIDLAFDGLESKLDAIIDNA